MDDSFVNQEVNLTLLWQSGLLNQQLYVLLLVESWSICYWLLKWGVLRVLSCVCVWERGRHGHTTAACVQTHTSIITVSVTWLCSPLGLELMVKLRTLLTVFTLILKAKARDYEKGHYISGATCGIRPITMHSVSWPIRADFACWKEGLCRKWSVWEKHRGPTIMYSIWKIMFFEY